MSEPQTAKTVQIPPPTRGMNVLDPVVGMDPSFARWVLNMDTNRGKVSLRHGYVKNNDGAIANGVEIFALAGGGAFDTFAYAKLSSGNHKIYNVSSGTATAVQTTGGSTSTSAIPFAFGSRIGFLTNAAHATESYVWDGSSWAAWGFTYSASPIGGSAVTSYKGRVYIFAGQKLYYSALGAVTGATTEVDLSTVFEIRANICWAEVLSSPSQNSDELYLAFGNSRGEILVYTGDYPDANNWQLIAQFKAAPPFVKNFHAPAIRYRNDILVLTLTGIISIRKLFRLDAESQESLTFSSYIDEYLQALMNAIIADGDDLHSSMVYWPEQNRIYVMFNGYIDRSGAYTDDYGTFAVYDVYSKSWSIHRIPTSAGTGSLIGFSTSGSELRYGFSKSGACRTMKRSRQARFKDQDPATATSTGYMAIPFEIESAFVDLGVPYIKKIIVGIEPLANTYLESAEVGYRAAADFGRLESATTFGTLIDGFQSGLYSVGAEGNYLQYVLLGTSGSESAADAGTLLAAGYDLYSVGLSVQ